MAGPALPGTYLIGAAEQLVLDVLSEHPEGLTNSRVGELTGLNPVIKTQNGYVTWTLLRHLIDKGRVEKNGELYKLSGEVQ
jgi:hypothetical protein